MPTNAPVTRRTVVAKFTVDVTPGVPVTFYEADRACRVSAGVGGANVYKVEGRVVGLPTVTYTAAAAPTDSVESVLAGYSAPSYGPLAMRNADGGIDDWNTYLWRHSGTVAFYLVDDDTPLPDTVSIAGLTPKIVARVRGFRPGAQSTFDLLDERDAFLRKSLVRHTYRGHQHAIRLNGTTHYADTAGANLTISTGNTVELWVSQNALPGSDAIVWVWGSAWAAANIEAYVKIGSGGKSVTFVVHRLGGGSATATFNSTIPLGDKFHLALAWDATASNLYVNGVHVAGAAGIAHTAGAVPLTIGRVVGAAANYAPITFDDVRVWPAVRTADEIAANYRAWIEGPTGTVAHIWHCQDGAGNTVVDTSAAATLVNLTLYPAAPNGPAWVSACEGTRDLAGKPMTRLLGTQINVKCTPVDPLRNIFRIADGPLGYLGPASGGGKYHQEFRDKGSAYILDTDEDNLDTFITTTPLLGHALTCLRHGLVRVVRAEGTVTCDTYGETLHSVFLTTDRAIPHYYRAVRLDGATEYATVDDLWQSLAEPFRFGIWVRTSTNGANQLIMSNKAGTAAGRRALAIASYAGYGLAAQARVFDDTGTEVRAEGRKGEIRPNTWYYLQVVWTPTTKTLDLYVNCVLAATATGGGTFSVAPDTTTYLGQTGAGSTFFNGDLGWVIADYISAGSGLINPFFNDDGDPSIGSWDFDEGSGTVVASTQGVSYPNINLVGDPRWVAGPAPDFAAAWLQVFVNSDFATYQAAGVGSQFADINSSFTSLPGYPLQYSTPDADATPLSDLIDSLLRTFGASLQPNDSATFGNTYTVSRISRPGYELVAGRTTLAADTSLDVPVYRGQVAALDASATQFPPSAIRVGYCRVAYAPDAGALNPTVSVAAREPWSEPYRYLTHKIPAMQAYAVGDQDAQPLTVDTLLLHVEDAQLVAEMFALLYGLVLTFYVLVLGAVDILPGGCANLERSEWPRHNVTTDPRFRALSVQVDHQASKQTVQCFRADDLE